MKAPLYCLLLKVFYIVNLKRERETFLSYINKKINIFHLLRNAVSLAL